MKVYKIKKLIHGYLIHKELKSKILVAFRLDRGYDAVEYQGIVQKIEGQPLWKEDFEDKFGRGSYTLVYYEWKGSDDTKISDGDFQEQKEEKPKTGTPPVKSNQQGDFFKSPGR